MKRNFLYVLSVLAMGLSVSCKKNIPADLSASGFIPTPVKVVPSGTSYQFGDRNVIGVTGQDELMPIAEYLKAHLTSMTGLEFVVETMAKADGDAIFLGLDDAEANDNSYVLDIKPGGVSLKGVQAESVFYGVQTLLQGVEYANAEKCWIIPGGVINDYPEYNYRGAMLDVSRHFFEVKDVKRLIDLMAVYKLNHLHLHLSDDQGWRIEIKSWPKLTEVGAGTAVGGGKGGYYTQEQYKELISYAKERFITIIPEIDMPGHTNAALASYAKLNCDGKARELYTGIEVGFSTLCTRKELTYEFVDDVIAELAAITEGPYIHIGGDESHVTAKDDYKYFVNRVREIVKSHGKVMIGWDEVAHADIDENDIVQYWAKDKNASLAVEKGAKVIMSPAKRAYLDMQYDSTTYIGLHWSGYVEVDQAYDWDPASLVEGIGRENIVGVESPLWTETVTNISDIEYLVFPRLAGHAEIGWSPAEKLDWIAYKERLAKHEKFFDYLQLNFYRSPKVEWGNNRSLDVRQ